MLQSGINLNISDEAVTKRICQLRRNYAGQRGKALFAKALGISPSTYNYYEQDRMPPAEILWAICELTGTDFRWLLTGEKTAGVGRLPAAMAEKITTLLAKNPSAGPALSAFVDLLAEKTRTEQQQAKPVPQVQHASPDRPASSDTTEKPAKTNDPAWLPILGGTAAGIVHFWSETPGKLPGVVELSDLIGRHKQADHNKVQPSNVSVETSMGAAEKLQSDQVKLIQLSRPSPDGICEFVDCPHIISRYPDAFALRVDGDSMAPRIRDRDIVVLSPSATARDGSVAVVKLRDQIGVTCKVIRHTSKKVHLIPVNENFDFKIYDEKKVEWSLAVLWQIRTK